MNKVFSIAIFLLFYCTILVAQTNLNKYKYIIVPNKYEFQKFDNQYELNSLTKFLFEKYNFTVLSENNNYPTDLGSDNCLALKANVTSIASLFKTKINIHLLDCTNTVIYTSKEGISKLKDYKRGYQQALRNAFAEFEKLNYEYNGKGIQTMISENVKDESDLAIKNTTVKTPKVQKPAIAKQSKKTPKVSKDKKVTTITKIEKEKKDPKKVVKVSLKNSLEGTFNFGKWGKNTVYKQGDYYVVSGGDENFKIASIYKTSKPTIFIIKWQAYKQPQLLQIDSEGNLKVDSNSGIKTYKRIN
jgi:hypothetical protein